MCLLLPKNFIVTVTAFIETVQTMVENHNPLIVVIQDLNTPQQGRLRTNFFSFNFTDFTFIHSI